MTSDIGAHAVQDEGYTPNEMARDAEALIARLTAERKAAAGAAERMELGKRIRSARTLLLFARTRAGYVKGPASRG